MPGQSRCGNKIAHCAPLRSRGSNSNLQRIDFGRIRTLGERWRVVHESKAPKFKKAAASYTHLPSFFLLSIAQIGNHRLPQTSAWTARVIMELLDRQVWSEEAKSHLALPRRSSQ